MSIYRPCDIRGHAEEELQPELYRRWGLALGAQLDPMSKFVVGGDVRASTPRFLAALVEGLCQAGLDVVDLGILPTPMIYYARRRLRAAACAVVTASHNPAEINGLKWSIGGRSPGAEEFALLEQAAEAPEDELPDGKPGTLRTLDTSFDYVGWLQQTWVRDNPVDLRIVVDPMHGCCGRRARRYLQAVFPMAPVSAIRDKPAADFGGTPPDCSNHDALETLATSVEHEGADLGIAFDGDGDRAAFVDDTGMILTAEEATSILLASFGTALDGETFVYDQKYSDQVPKTAGELGAKTVVERSGHTFIRNRMLQTSALFGAEISGHYFFHDLGGSDDGLFAACRMIDYVARSGQSLSQLRRACPAVFMTPELRVPVDPQNQQSVIDHVQAHWLQYPHTLIDGVRVDFPNGWALARSSVTEPVMTFRFEASDWADLDKLVWEFSDGLPHAGDALWARYEAAVGKHCHPG